MSKLLLTAFASTFLLLSGTGLSIADPIQNDDGSKTCNASGPSSGNPNGVCANDLATNEGFCDGGWSSEPGGGTTCSEPSAKRGVQNRINQIQMNAPAPKPRSAR